MHFRQTGVLKSKPKFSPGETWIKVIDFYPLPNITGTDSLLSPDSMKAQSAVIEDFWCMPVIWSWS